MADTDNELPESSLEPSPSPLTDSQCEFMPETPEKPEDESRVLYLDMEPLKTIANGKSVRVPRNPHFSRKDVVNAFQSAFELIGGVPRLALWADQNESEFFKLYARLLPSQASSALGETNKLIIEMRVPHSALDDQEVPPERREISAPV